MEGQLNGMFISFVTDDYYAKEFQSFLSFLSHISPEGDAIFNLFYEAVTFFDTSATTTIINSLKLGQVLRIFQSRDRTEVLERMRPNGPHNCSSSDLSGNL